MNHPLNYYNMNFFIYYDGNIYIIQVDTMVLQKTINSNNKV